MKTLLDVTGNESGAVVFGDGEVVVCNWSSIAGLPRQLGAVLIGLGEDLSTYEPSAVPEAAVDAMIAHCAETDPKNPWMPADGEMRAVFLPQHNVVVCWSREWN